MNDPEITSWLEHDDAESRPHRAQRLKQVLETIQVPENGFLFFGGTESSLSFNEAKFCYIHGLHLSTVLLCLIFIEQELAATLYADGIEKAKRLKLEDLLSLGVEKRLITKEEEEIFHKLRDIRNSFSHFRSMDHSSKLLRRAMNMGIDYESILEEDAFMALRSMSLLVHRRAIP